MKEKLEQIKAAAQKAIAEAADEKGIDIRVVDTAGNVLKEHKITKNNR